MDWVLGSGTRLQASSFSFRQGRTQICGRWSDRPPPPATKENMPIFCSLPYFTPLLLKCPSLCQHFLSFFPFFQHLGELFFLEGGGNSRDSYQKNILPPTPKDKILVPPLPLDSWVRETPVFWTGLECRLCYWLPGRGSRIQSPLPCVQGQPGAVYVPYTENWLQRGATVYTCDLKDTLVF